MFSCYRLFSHSHFPEAIIAWVVIEEPCSKLQSAAGGFDRTPQQATGNALAIAVQKSIFAFFKEILKPVCIGGTKLMKESETYKLKNVPYP